MTEIPHSMGHFPCVGGPMSGRLCQAGLGSHVSFPIYSPSKRYSCGKLRRARYDYATGECGTETWTYLKFVGYEK